MDTNRQVEDNTIPAAAEMLGRDMLEALLDELKVAPDAWQKMSQIQQEQTIERLRKRTKTIIEQSLRVLLRGDYPACVATLERVNFSGGIKAQITVTKGAQSRHELADAVGTQVIVVIGDPDQYRARMEEIKASADQPDLFDSTSNRTYDPSQDQPLYRSDEPAQEVGKSWADLMGDGNSPAAAGVDKSPLAIAIEALAALDVYPDVDKAQLWTEAEIRVATEWAKDAQSGGTMARPHWLPIPVTEIGDARPGEGEDAPLVEDDDGEILFGSAADPDHSREETADETHE